MSGVQALNALAHVICTAQKRGKQTPMGLAVAIDSAQMLMCPETAADLDRLRKRVAELEAELKARPAYLIEGLAEPGSEHPLVGEPW